MRKGICLLMLVLGVAGCGNDLVLQPDTVASHIDGLLKAGIEDLPVRILPSTARKQHLYPDQQQGESNARGYLSKNEHGAALLALDQAAVPALTGLLRDPRRRALAAVFLGEIGGQDAAKALLEMWRDIRDNARTRSAIIGDGEYYLLNTVYETPDDKLVPVLTHSLSLCGLPIVEQIAADTQTAMNAGEALHKSGTAVRLESETELHGHPARVVRWVDPVETAKEGLGILAMLGGPEVIPVLAHALRSPIATIRWRTTQDSWTLAYEAEPLLPALLEALRDPEFRGPALNTLQKLFMTGESSKRVDPEPTEAQWAEIVERWTKRIATEQIPRTRTKTTTTSHGG